MTARHQHDTDRGDAVVEFVLVTVLLVGLFLIVVQVGVVLHTRNVLVAAAAEGARYGANADRTPQQGAERTRQVVAEALSARTTGEVQVAARQSGADGLAMVEVEVTSRLPVAFLPVGPATITVRGHALEEGP